VLALALANIVGAVLFGTLYAVAGASLMPQGAFLVCLPVLFVLITALWIRIERRHRMLGLLRRVGRVAIGLMLVVFAVPAVVLMPVFWLDTMLPPEAGLTSLLAPIMTIVLIALVLVGLVNVVGCALAVLQAVLSIRERSRPLADV
jgi:hypothetical protein